MADVKNVRRKFTLVLIVLLCIDLACGLVLISPIGRSARTSEKQLSDAWSDLQIKTRENLPLQGIDGKVQTAKSEIQEFYASRLPDRFAAIPDELGKLASGTGVTLSSARYKTEDTEIPGVRRVTIQATLAGPYVREARFINAVERNKVFFIIDSISLGEAENGVRLQIELETYLRSEATA